MSKSRDIPRSLLHRLGVAGPARVRVFKGNGVLSAVLLALGVLALTATPALAGDSHAFSKSFGAKGSGAGQMELTSNSGMAVNDTTHNIYVADTGNRRIDEFEADGEFVQAFGREVGPLGEDTCTTLSTCKAGASGSEPGEFEAPVLIAVDNAAGGEGDVYVADTGTGLVQKFTAEGALVRPWGVEGQLGTVPITVTRATGNLEAGSKEVTGVKLISGKFHQNQEILGEGIPLGDFYAETSRFEEGDLAFETILPLRKPATETKTGVTITARRPLSLPPPNRGIAAIAVNAAGDLWVSSNALFEFDQGGAFVQEWFGNEAPPPSGATGDADVSGGAVLDQTTNELYVDTGALIEDIGPAGNVLETFGSSALSDGGGAGVAVDSSSGAVYADNAITDQVEAYDVALEVNTSPASEVTTTTATLNGTINPKGSEVRECDFEYVEVAAYLPKAADPYRRGATERCEETPAEIGSGTSDVEVHAKIAGLRGGTSYDYRLKATRENILHEKTTVLGEDEAFPTSPVASIAGAEAVEVSASSWQLKATVNPHGVQVTRCVFEYGTSTEYGEAAKCEQKKATIGAGTEPVPVSVTLSELQPGVEYHWRLVVKDANGETFGVDHTFVYPTTAAQLSDHRSYEMVTPPFKNGALVGHCGICDEYQLSRDGSRVIAGSIQCFAGSPSCNATRGETFGEPFAFSRTPTGWITTPLAPSASEFTENTAYLSSAEAGAGALFSMPAGPAGEEEWYKREADGSFVRIGPVTGPAVTGTSPIQAQEKLATADLSHLVWEAKASRSGWLFDNTVDNDSSYEYAGTGRRAPLLLGVAGGFENGENHNLISTCGTGFGASGSRWDAVSADGRTVYFTAAAKSPDCAKSGGEGPPVNELFARVDGEESDAHTVALSEPDAPQTTAENPPDDNCTSAECEKNIGEEVNWRTADFTGASEDGSRGFFLSDQQLTDTAAQGAQVESEACANSDACNLYEYDSGAPAGHNLIDASAPEGGGSSPGVQGVLATSADGSHVYFVAHGKLADNSSVLGREAIEGEDNLYVYARDAKYPAGHLAFIAALSGASQRESETWTQGSSANVTPGGRFLVFASAGDLTPDDTRDDGSEQIFRYDAETEQLVRISIGDEGYDDDGNGGGGDATIVPSRFGITDVGPARGDPSISDDGVYVFFQSPIALTPHALNDVVIGHYKEDKIEYAQNVYEYHDGHVYLISDGHDTAVAETICEVAGVGQSATCLLGTDATGQNVFFTTADQLVPKDTDTQLDIYDARVCEPENGNPCIAEPLPPLPPCGGEQCHGIPAATPSLLAPGTASFNGEGNIASSPPSPAVKPKVTRKTTTCKRGYVKKNVKKKEQCVKAKRKKPAMKSSHRKGDK